MTQMFLASFALGSAARPIAPELSTLLATVGCEPRERGQGLTLFAQNELTVRSIAGKQGFVLGQLFDKAGAPAPNELAAHSECDAIVEHFWGNYVALVGRASALRIMRDPSGGLGCYHAQVDGVFYVTSIPHILIDAGILVVDLDWAAVGRSLTRHASRSSTTALRGIEEVLPGTELSVSAGGSSVRPVWDPWRSANSPVGDEPAEVLEGVLTSTLAAWGRCTRRPLIEISGGLDSAIVAAGVAPAAPGASLITFAPAPGDPDETLYARAIAEHLGLDLEIAHPQTGDVDLAVSLARDLPRPNARAFVQAADRASLLRARAIGADAFVSGGGGDDVFCYLRTISPALDRMGDEGVRAMLGTLRDIAKMNHANVWDALHRAVRRIIRGRSAKPVSDTLLLGSWFDGLADDNESVSRDGERRPGKADHVDGILTIHNYLEGNARSGFAPILSPLLSQPIVECCLSIPSWLWCEDGRNRAVARHAYADRLPSNVIERKSKGSFDAFCAHLLEANRELVSDMMMTGRLVEYGLVDGRSLARALENPFPPAETITRILALVDAESWVRSWQTRAPQRD